MPKSRHPRPGRLTKRGLKRELLRLGLPKINIVFYDETDSTNTRARRFAECCEEKKRCDTLFIARRQKGGRGRLGRSFLSEGETGLWMTLLRFKEASATVSTVEAAVAVCRALESETCGSLRLGIKWVNDILIGRKKLCGILAESGHAEDGGLPYTVLGIGINLYKTDFPRELSELATDLYTECGLILDRARLAAAVIRELYACRGGVMDEYRQRCVVLGEKVTVTRGSESFVATVTDLDGEGALIVTDKNGEIKRLISGEVSIRRT